MPFGASLPQRRRWLKTTGRAPATKFIEAYDAATQVGVWRGICQRAVLGCPWVSDAGRLQHCQSAWAFDHHPSAQAP